MFYTWWYERAWHLTFPMTVNRRNCIKDSTSLEGGGRWGLKRWNWLDCYEENEAVIVPLVIGGPMDSKVTCV